MKQFREEFGEQFDATIPAESCAYSMRILYSKKGFNLLLQFYNLFNQHVYDAFGTVWKELGKTQMFHTDRRSFGIMLMVAHKS